MAQLQPSTPDASSPAETIAEALRLHRAGKLRQAHSLYCRVLSAQPNNANVLSRMGLLLHQTGQNAAAVKMLHRALEARPDHAETLATLGRALLAMGETASAVSHFERAVALKPGFVSAHNGLGRALAAAGRLEKAIAAFKRAIVLEPSYAEAHYNLGCALEREGRHEDAIRCYRKAVAIDPRLAKARDALGLALRAHGALDEAEAAFRRAIEDRPDFTAARIHLAELLVEKGAIDDAAKEYRAVAAERPETVEAHHGLGRIAAIEGRNDEAAGHFEKAIALAPERVEAHVDLGRLQRLEGRYDDAIAQLLEAIALAPEKPGAYVELGRVLFEQGYADQAIEQYEKALSLDGGDAEAFRHLGAALLARGRYDEARAAFHNVLRARHGGRWWNAERFLDVGRGGGARPRPVRISTFRLRDHMEQVTHLVERGLLDRSFEAMAERYRQVLAEVEHAVGDDGQALLGPAQIDRIGGFLDRVVRFADTPRIDGAVLDDDLDLAAAERSLLDEGAAAARIDRLLSPAAFEALRAFCRETTIFFRDPAPGIVGADLASGFNCELVYRLAGEIKARMPRLLGEFELAEARAWRHRNRHPGGPARREPGALALLLWLSPRAACDDPEGGGLILEPSDGAIAIPHGENRAVLFRADAPHRAAPAAFADGFANRRTEVVFLFRRRRDGG